MEVNGIECRNEKKIEHKELEWGLDRVEKSEGN